MKSPASGKRFHGTVRVDLMRLGRNASTIANEHLSKIDGVELEISADSPDGAGEKLVSDVTENRRTLKLESYGFEG